MKKVIIGIHGLKNKPAPELLSNWWKTSIADGLNKFDKNIDFNFKLVYWADLDYSKPLNENETDPEHSLYIQSPYVKEAAVEEQKGNLSLKKRILINLETSLDTIFLRENSIGGLDKIADKAIHKMFTDLDLYYHGYCQYRSSLPAKVAFRKRLADVIRKYQHQQIMIIGHSMGSIIAYDTLIYETPEVSIDRFLSIGSPLGLAIIIKKILQEQNREISPDSQPQTPENINSLWLNFADLDDKVALIYRIANDYAANTKGLKPLDIQVDNQYQYKDEIYPHNVYGYLRTPEVAKQIYQFLKS